MNKLVPCYAFEAVAANQTAILDLLPTVGGNTLEALWLKQGGTFTFAHMTGIRLKANNKTIWETTGSAQDLINNYRDINTATGYLLLDFMEPKFRTVNAFSSGALELSRNSGINQLTLEVDIGGATNPTLTAHAAVSPAGPLEGESPLLRFMFLRRHRAQINVPAAGEFAIAVPHMNPSGASGSLYKRINLLASSSDITAIRVRRQGIDEFNCTVALMQELQAAAGRVPQSGHIAFDPVLDNILAGRVWDTTSRLPSDPVRPGAGCTSAEFFVTAAAAVTFWVETEEFALLNDF